MYVYLGDGTPGFDTEADQIALEAEVYATPASLCTASRRTTSTPTNDHAVEYDRLADPDGAVLDAFGAERGHDYPTFVLADEEVSRGTRRSVACTPDGRARDVLLDRLDDGLVSL